MVTHGNSMVTPSSGNVFADLGLPNAEGLWAKVRLAASINAILAQRGLTQVQTARVLGVSQPKVSALRGYKLGGGFGGAADALRDRAGA